MSGLPSPPTTGDFHRPELAAEHLCDHVLTRPEAHDWPLLLSGYRCLVDPTNDERLTQLARSLFVGTPAPEVLELLQRYQEAISQAVGDALRLGWWWEQRQGNYSQWCGLGLSGLYVVWDRQVIQTGMLHRNARWPPPHQQPRNVNPLPRRRHRERLRPPSVESPRSQYHLFKDNHYLVSREYETAYNQGKVGPVAGAGATIFVENPLEKKDWERLIRERP